MLKLIRNAIVASFLSVAFTFSYAAPVDINTADAATLAEAISGIGPSKAKAIVDYRTANGRFATIDDLVNVQGIGFKTLDRIRDFVIVAPGGSSGSAASSASSSLKAVSPSVSDQPALPVN